MKYRVHLTEQRHGRTDSDGSNYLTSYVDGDDCIEWEIVDNVVAETFVKSFNMIKSVDESRGSEVSPATWIAWNRYSSGDNVATDWLNNIDSLNAEVMYAINNEHCDFKQSKHIIKLFS